MSFCFQLPSARVSLDGLVGVSKRPSIQAILRMMDLLWCPVVSFHIFVSGISALGDLVAEAS